MSREWREFHITEIDLSQDRGYGNEDQREREDQWSLLGKFYWEKTKKTSHEKYQNVGHNSICTDT